MSDNKLRLNLKLEPPGIELVYEKKKLKAILRAAGSEVAGVARNMVRRSAGTGRKYRVGNRVIHTASAPGQIPTSLSGNLARSIKSKVAKSGQYVRIISDYYGLFLEYGAQGGAGGARAREAASGKFAPGGEKTKGKRNRRNARGEVLAIVGRRKLEPRPFLSAALEDRGDSVAERIRESIAADMAFRKIK